MEPSKDTFWMSLPGFAGNISSCTQHSRRAAPLDPSPVMQSCAARLNARLMKQSVNCELLCIIPLCTFTSESMRSWPLQRSGGSSCGFSLAGVSSSPPPVCHQLNLTSAQVVFPAFLIVPSLLYLGEPVKGTSKCTSCPCT